MQRYIRGQISHVISAVCQGLLSCRRHIGKREDPGDEVGVVLVEEGAIFDSFDEFHHQKCAVKHYVMNELVMGRASQKNARGNNPQITFKRRDRWSL